MYGAMQDFDYQPRRPGVEVPCRGQVLGSGIRPDKCDLALQEISPSHVQPGPQSGLGEYPVPYYERPSVLVSKNRRRDTEYVGSYDHTWEGQQQVPCHKMPGLKDRMNTCKIKLRSVCLISITVKARKMEYDCLPTP